MKKCITVNAVVLLFAVVAAATELPRYEAFLGYTYVRANQFNQNAGLGQAIGGYDMNGGSGQFIYNFNKWISGVGDFGAVYKPNVPVVNVTNTTAFTLAGPRVYYRKGRFSPFGQVLFGAMYRFLSKRVNVLTGPDTPILPVANPSTLFPGPAAVTVAQLSTTQTAFAMEAGGGLDYRISRHFSVRPVEVDYVLTRFPDPSTGFRENQNSIAASAGFIFTFGGEKPAPQSPAPQTKTCPDGTVVAINAACPKQNFSFSLVANPQELCPGETAQISATGVDLQHMNRNWSVNGQPVSQGTSFVFTGRDPGTYTIGLTAKSDKFNAATAQTTVVVKEYRPPTGTVQANPAQIYAGDKSMLSASFDGQCGGPIQSPRYTASEGTVQGDQFDSSTVQFDPSNKGEQRKTITITAKAADNRSEGTATTTIEVIQKATVAPVRLPDILFSDNSARVNNCGKRVLLEQLRGYYERDSSGSVVLVGHQSSDETPADLSEQRSLNAAAVITAGSGVCLSIPRSQVQISAPGTDQQGVSFDPSFCASSVRGGASSEARRVVVWFVPNGGQMPPSVTNAQAASSTSVGNLGCPK